MALPKSQPRICFVGPMLGKNNGWVVTQGEILADLFLKEGYEVRLTSSIPYRIARLADILTSLILWRNSLDIVVLAIFSGPGFAASDFASLATRLIGKPLVYVLRGGNLPDFAARHPTWIKRVLNRADRIVSPSGYLADYFGKWGFDVDVIPNVLSLGQYPYRHREHAEPRLLWMRTFHPIYHPEMAVEVLRILAKELPDICLTMAGQEKGLLETVKHLADQENLQNKIRFAGFLDQAAKQAEFSAHDIYLNTNRIDNMPVSVIEAAAFGLPVVATRVGGIPYLLENEQTGLLVDDCDSQAMAQAVKRLIQDPVLTARLSKNGRELAESCSWKRVYRQWIQVFESVRDQHD